MNKDKHIPQGYKDSPLGIIPKEWEVKRLGDCTNLLTNGFVGVATPHYTEDKDGITYIQGFNVTEGGFNLTGIKRVTKVFHEKNKKSSLLEGDLLTIQTGDIGLTTIVPKELEGSNCHALIISRFRQIILPHFMLYYYNSSIGRNRFRVIETGSTMKHINTGDLFKFLIPVPPISEQEAIIKIIQLWDTAIKKQSKLIEKLTLRKCALMQQLLTAKKRLTGFSGEWKRMAIKTFAKEVSIRNGSGNEYIVLSCTKYDGLVPSLEYFGKQIYSNDLSSYKIVPQNHFVYATNHVEEGSIGYQSNYENGLISPMYTVFSTNDNIVENSFLFAILKSHHLIYLYQSMMEGSINRRGGLRWDSFSTIKINLPSLDEQKAISVFLHDMDKEIALANEKLANLESQKRGLMQQLLTGKKRVV